MTTILPLARSLALVTLGLLPVIAVEARTETVAVSGMNSPDGVGQFTGFDLPRLGDVGGVAFIAGLSELASASGVFHYGVPPVSGNLPPDPFRVPTLRALLRVGEVSPDGDGVLSGFQSLASFEGRNPYANFKAYGNWAVLATFGNSPNQSGIISGDPSGYLLNAPAVVARLNQSTSGGSTVLSIGTPATSGGTVFTGRLNDTSWGEQRAILQGGGQSYPPGVLFTAPGNWQQALRLDELGNSGWTNLQFTNFGVPATAPTNMCCGGVNNLAFRADYITPTGDPSLDSPRTGVFRFNNMGFGLSLVDYATPELPAMFSDPVTNLSGTVAYQVNAGLSGQERIRVAQGLSPQTIAAAGNLSPDANGSFTDFTAPALSNAYVAFRASLTNTQQGLLDTQGLYRHSIADNDLRAVLRTNQFVPGESARFLSFGKPVVNDSGVLLFAASTGTGIGGQLAGLYLSDGIDLAKVVRQGDALDGSFVMSAEHLDLPDRGGLQALNDYGQVAYRANLLDGRQAIRLFTPELHFKGSGEASWINPENWSFGLLPGQPHDVFIAPATDSVTVEIGELPGPGRSFRSLTIAPAHGASATLRFGGGVNWQEIQSEMWTVGAGGVVLNLASSNSYVRLKELHIAGGTVDSSARPQSIGTESLTGFGRSVDLGIAGNWSNGAIRASGGLLEFFSTDGTYVPYRNMTADPASTLRLVQGGQQRFELDNQSLILNGGTIEAPFGLYANNNVRVTGHGRLSTRFVGSADSAILAEGGVLEVGDPTQFGAVAIDGTMSVRDGATLSLLNRISPVNLGRDTALEGGTLRSTSGLALGSGRVLRGHGAVEGALQAQTGSTVFSEGDLVVGDANALDGYYSDGRLYVENHHVRLRDRNEATLGALTVLGNAAGAGTLTADKGYVLGFGKALSGYGDVFGDLLNNGLVEGLGPQSTDAINLHGLVKGVGAYAGTVIFSGVFSPGLSPAQVSLENFVAVNETVIELAGLAPGAGHDRIDASGTAVLGGRLRVELLDGFIPQAGDAFTFLAALGGISGEFDEVLFPTVAGLRFGLEYASNEVRLFAASPVPLPPAALMFAPAMLGLVLFGRARSVRP